jgi:PEP-CTERM motif
LSVDGGVTNIAFFNQNQDGDMADFAGDLADGGANQCGQLTGSGGGQLIQNAFNCAGPDEPYISAAPEFPMGESIGWDPTSSSAIPEPATLALLGTSLCGIGILRRRRRASR